jgi:hypothetical protein
MQRFMPISADSSSRLVENDELDATNLLGVMQGQKRRKDEISEARVR